MHAEAISFEEWLALSKEEQVRLQSTWNPYGDGYWHQLRAQAEERFRQDYGSMPRIVAIHGGVYHGGTLIIGVILDTLHEASSLGIPSWYAGFHVMQFGSRLE